MSVTIDEILKKFPAQISLHSGNQEIEISGLNAPQLAKKTEIVFLSQPQHLMNARNGKSQIWVVQDSLIQQIEKPPTCLLQSHNPVLAMAFIGRTFFPRNEYFQIVDDQKIHPSAVISESAKVGENVRIGPGAVIGKHVTIGAGTVVGANAVIENRAEIGAECIIHPLVMIAREVILKNRVEVLPHSTIGSDGFGYAQDEKTNHHRLVHYGRVVLEDDVHIGAGVQIDRGTFGDTVVGKGTKIDNHCHIAHNVQIGEKTLITGGFISAGSSTIGSYCVIGGRTTVSGHISITDRVQLGGLSGVAQSIDAPGAYAGFPLQTVKESLRTRSLIADLPKLRSQVREILKHLNLTREER